jgi:putative cell wall-binding protein
VRRSTSVVSLIAAASALSLIAAGCAATPNLAASSQQAHAVEALTASLINNDTAIDDQPSLEEPTLTIIPLSEFDDSPAAAEAVETEDLFQTVAATWPQGEPAPDLRIRVRDTDGQWGDWMPLEDDGVRPDPGTEEAEQARAGTDSIYVGDAEAIQVETGQDASASQTSSDVELVLVGSEEGAPTSALTATQAAWIRPAGLAADTTTALYMDGTASTITAASTPTAITRAQWGAAAPKCSMAASTKISLAVVHHTAGGNTYSTKEQAMQQLRNDQKYHMSAQGRDWCDLGYNYVIDKWGNLYEGRKGSQNAKPTIGVHASGFNTNTLGVSVLGNYDTVDMPAAVINTLGKIIGPRLAANNVRPNGSVSWKATMDTPKHQKGKTYTMPAIIGHRDVAATACPGKYGYAKMANIRNAAMSALTVPRIAGADRYATAAAISAKHFPANQDLVYVASGENFPDALSASAAAGWLGAPLLITSSKTLPATIVTELKRLKPARIVIVGGAASVSAAVANSLKQYATSGTVTRLAGADRYDTSAAISAATFPEAPAALTAPASTAKATSVAAAGGVLASVSGETVTTSDETPIPPRVTDVFIATGTNFPDALVGGPAAALHGGPILLIPPTGAIPAATQKELKRLKPDTITILGGTASLSAQTEKLLQGYAGTVRRWAGADRFATAATIGQQKIFGTVNTVYITTGHNFPDALAGAAAAGKIGSPILTVTQDSIPAATKTALSKLKPSNIILLGSTNAVNASVASALAGYIVYK